MNIFTIISPLVLVALLGFICTKSQWFTRIQLDTLTKFTFYISIPAFLFYQMAKADFSNHVNPSLFAAFYIPVLLCYLIAWSINRYFYVPTNKPDESTSCEINIDLPKKNAASAVYALGSSYSNTVIVGLPVLLMVLGEQVVAIVFLIVTFHSALLFALTSAIASNQQHFDWSSFIKQTFNNPIIISILCGLLFNLSGLNIPIVIVDTLQLLGKPAITLALFILGASLTFYQIKNELKFITLASLLKLFLLPSLVYLFSAIIFSLGPMLTTVLVILSASPTGVNAYLIAKKHGIHQETVAGTVVMSTLASVITIPLWLWWLNAV